MYVLIEAPGSEGGVYRSDDRGASWVQVSDYQAIRNRPFYYTNLVAHPVDPDILWGMAEGYSRSNDGGRTWGSGGRTPHGDNHDLWINPDDSGHHGAEQRRGGANVTRDGGQTWSTQHNQPTAELYQVDISDDFPYRLYAGQQDNSTISVPSLPDGSTPGGAAGGWEAHGGCETGPVVPKPGRPGHRLRQLQGPLRRVQPPHRARASNTTSDSGTSTAGIPPSSLFVSSASRRSMCPRTTRTASITGRSLST